MMILRKLCTTVASSATKVPAATHVAVDYEKVFTHPKTQQLLKSLTGCDPLRIFRSREIKQLEKATYLLMTEEDVSKMEQNVKARCEQRLRMPPFKKPRSNLPTILSQDPEIADFDNVKFVFTDIDPEVHRRDRLVVVREPDGTLRTATDDERDRMNRVYFPTTGQQVHKPEAFREPYFTKNMDEKKYEFLLDWACTQFEPDDALFIEITNKVYDHVNQTRNWSILHSTRYYGPMVFYLMINGTHEELLCSLIKECKLDDAANLVRIFFICHPNKLGPTVSISSLDFLTSRALLQVYSKQYAQNPSLVSWCLDKAGRKDQQT